MTYPDPDEPRSHLDFREDDPFRPAPPPSQRTVANLGKTTRLQDLNLDGELAEQLASAKALIRSAEFDDTVPLSQKAQTINVINTLLSGIVRMQAEVKNIQEITKLETALVDTLKEFPEVKEHFLSLYEGKLLAELASPSHP